MLKINFTHKVFLLKRNVCFRNLIYFTRKEERSVYKNRFMRSYEVYKEDLSVKKAR